MTAPWLARRQKIEPKREARLVQEMSIDAYTEDERALSWYYNLKQELPFPSKLNA